MTLSTDYALQPFSSVVKQTGTIANPFVTQRVLLWELENGRCVKCKTIWFCFIKCLLSPRVWFLLERKMCFLEHRNSASQRPDMRGRPKDFWLVLHRSHVAVYMWKQCSYIIILTWAISCCQMSFECGAFETLWDCEVIKVFFMIPLNQRNYNNIFSVAYWLFTQISECLNLKRNPPLIC